MKSVALFFKAVLGLLAAGLAIAFDSLSSLKSFFRTDDGLGVLKGIILFMLFGVLIAGYSVFVRGQDCLGCHTYHDDSPYSRAVVEAPRQGWFLYSKLFLGLDYTKKQSPMCERGGPDDHLTSNGGLLFNIYTFNRFELNAKYTHHSCAFSPDAKSYDALGIELDLIL